MRTFNVNKEHTITGGAGKTRTVKILTILALIVCLGFPQNSYAINQAVDVENIEQNVMVEDGQQAQEFADEQGDMQAQDTGVVDNLEPGMNASDFDLILEIPVTLENLYPQVSRYGIICYVGERDQDMAGGYFFHEGHQFAFLYDDVAGGSYNGLFRFFFAIPQDQTPEDIDYYWCRSRLYGDGFISFEPRFEDHVDPESDFPAWATYMTGSTFHITAGWINW